MSDFISGLASQFIQQTLQNPAAKQTQQPVAAEKRSFESYLQQQENKVPNGDTNTIQNPATQTTSGTEMSQKLDELQTQLSQKINQTGVDQQKYNKMLPEWMNTETRMGMLKDAYGNIPNTSKVTSDLGGKFIQLENEYKGVEAIMTSSNNLSPGELLALQARLYQVSQHIEVMSKVIDQMAGGIKTVLNTSI
ncbi:MAG: hypothetical protein ABIP06_11855 [Pyrinomonadaceae bacterium]